MLHTPTRIRGTVAGASVSRSASIAQRWFLDWSFYLVIAVAAFLRFFRLQTTEFDFDQANLFQLARDLITHGLFPLSSNGASIGILNPPFFIYTLVPAAAISGNPLGAAITVSLFTTAAAGLTYLFTKRYFGWFPALVAGLLYATVYVPLKYSRGIWQPDLLTFFLLLFLFSVFRGAVERKQGWLAPAVALLAIMYQLHPSSIVGPCVMVLLAFALEPGTVRWRDLCLAIIAALVLFLPYIVLQFLTSFSDIKGLLAFSHLPARTDTQALQFYHDLLFPYNVILTPWMNLLGHCLQILLALGVLVAIVRCLRPHRRTVVTVETTNPWLQRWNRLRLNPERMAFLLLLTWQIIPFANLIHHSIDLHMQYLLVFLPGPFILMGLSLDECVFLIKRWRPRLTIPLHTALLLLSMLLVVGQFVGTTAYLLMLTGGHFNDRTIQNIPYVNDLNSLEHAVQLADQVARQHHITRIFMSMDTNVQPTMSYLSATLHTPTTAFGNGDCLPLANTSAVYLVGPYADDVDALLHRFANVTLVAQPPRLGGKPFRLYITTPLTTPLTTTRVTSTAPATLAVGDEMLALSRWDIQRQAAPSPRTIYNYQFSLSTAGISTTCTATALHKDDQLVVGLVLPAHTPQPALDTIQGRAFDGVPAIYHLGPFQLTAFINQTINRPFASDLRPLAAD